MAECNIKQGILFIIIIISKITIPAINYIRKTCLKLELLNNEQQMHSVIIISSANRYFILKFSPLCLFICLSDFVALLSLACTHILIDLIPFSITLLPSIFLALHIYFHFSSLSLSVYVSVYASVHL